MHAALGILLSLFAPPVSAPMGPAAPRCARPDIRIAIAAAPDMNGGRPIRIALVFVTDPALARLLAAMDSRSYFAAKEQLKQDFRRGWTVREWELQAQQYAAPAQQKAPCGTIAALLFANYHNDGAHRLSLPPSARGTLSLGATEMAWLPDR